MSTLPGHLSVETITIMTKNQQGLGRAAIFRILYPAIYLRCFLTNKDPVQISEND